MGGSIKTPKEIKLMWGGGTQKSRVLIELEEREHSWTWIGELRFSWTCWNTWLWKRCWQGVLHGLHGFHLRLVLRCANVTPSLPPASSAWKAQAGNEENRLENPLSLGESFLALQKPERATKKTTPPTAIRRPVLHSDQSSATNGVNQQKYLLKHF